MRRRCQLALRQRRPWWSLVVATACAVIVGTPRPAGAERVGVVIIEVAEAPAPREQVRGAASAGAAKLGSVIESPFGVAREAITEGALPRSVIDGFARAEEVMSAGWRAYLSVAAEFAASRLIAARQEAEPLVPYQGGRSLYAEISLRLGAVYLHLGRVGDAHDAFRLCAALDPRREVTENEFSPDIVAEFVKATGAVLPRHGVEFRVRAEAGGAVALELDGAAVAEGRSRLELSEGRHLLVARAEGHLPMSLAFAVSAEPSTHRIELTLERDGDVELLRRGEGALSPGTSESAATASISRLAIFADLDEIVLVASVWRRGAPAVIVQRCLSAPVIDCRRPVEVGHPNSADLPVAMGDAIARAGEGDRGFPVLLPSDVRVARAERRPVGGGSKQARCQLCRSPWLWVGVGAAALSAGALYLSTRDRDTVPVIQVDPCLFGQCPAR